jgi:hypothetical protein
MDKRFHDECVTCPRCGGSTVIFDLRGNPLWFRCIGCLHGWVKEAASIIPILPRAEKEMKHFTTHVILNTTGEGEK